MSFQSGEFEVAEKYLRDALLKVKYLENHRQSSYLVQVEAVSKGGMAGAVSAGLAEKWESLLSNLGHTYRKLARWGGGVPAAT